MTVNRLKFFEDLSPGEGFLVKFHHDRKTLLNTSDVQGEDETNF